MEINFMQSLLHWVQNKHETVCAVSEFMHSRKRVYA